MPAQSFGQIQDGSIAAFGSVVGMSFETGRGEKGKSWVSRMPQLATTVRGRDILLLTTLSQEGPALNMLNQ